MHDRQQPTQMVPKFPSITAVRVLRYQCITPANHSRPRVHASSGRHSIFSVDFSVWRAVTGRPSRGKAPPTVEFPVTRDWGVLGCNRPASDPTVPTSANPHEGQGPQSTQTPNPTGGLTGWSVPRALDLRPSGTQKQVRGAVNARRGCARGVGATRVGSNLGRGRRRRPEGSPRARRRFSSPFVYVVTACWPSRWREGWKGAWHVGGFSGGDASGRFVVVRRRLVFPSAPVHLPPRPSLTLGGRRRLRSGWRASENATHIFFSSRVARAAPPTSVLHHAIGRSLCFSPSVSSPTRTRQAIAMAEATAVTSPLMGAVNKIKESVLHVISQVRARGIEPDTATQPHARRVAFVPTHCIV